MQALIAILILPLMLLNFLGGIVGVIWLMILGEWGALGIALIATVFPGTFSRQLRVIGQIPMRPNHTFDRSAQRRRRWVPTALRAPAPGQCGR